MENLDLYIDGKKYEYITDVELNGKKYIAYADDDNIYIHGYELVNDELNIIDITEEEFNAAKEAMEL